jgi:hypothetical protein
MDTEKGTVDKTPETWTKGTHSGTGHFFIPYTSYSQKSGGRERQIFRHASLVRI